MIDNMTNPFKGKRHVDEENKELVIKQGSGGKKSQSFAGGLMDGVNKIKNNIKNDKSDKIGSSKKYADPSSKHGGRHIEMA